ncbi:MAG: ribonucleoside-diphosphate reductase beta chain, partial [Patescibacteria group bacterium]|nr:ribonucleoside-diphosphate reductase beta chain [Patescibacteria group bacterium]
EKIKHGVELEKRYAYEALPKGIVGLTPQSISEYLEHIADRRLERINLKPVYGTKNPFPWMSEIIDARKEKNFFETRVNEYKTGGQLEW